jgi:hypothetical protein
MLLRSLYRKWSLAALGLLLGACAPLTAVGQAPTAEVTDAPAGVAVVVDAVTVEIGQGSPLPVSAIIDGRFPDECAQIVAVEQQVVDTEFQLTVLTTAGGAECQSPMGDLPFRMAVPLNAVALEPGTYTVTVNTASTTFSYPLAAASLP